jgi:hypothetical protein
VGRAPADVFRFGLDVDDDGVALVEGAALRVLAAEAHGRAGGDERGEGGELGHAVVEGARAGGHFQALVEELLHLGMDVEAVGDRGGEAREFGDALDGKAGATASSWLEGIRRGTGSSIREGGEHGLALGAAGGFWPSRNSSCTRAHFGFGIDADALLGVDFVERRVVLDGGVAAGLGDGGVVDLAVAVAAVADEIDDDVGVEAMAELGCDGGDADDGVGVLGVDVEDGDGQALGDVGGEARGVGLLGQGGEAEQVVHDYMHGPADIEAGQRVQDEALGENALAGEGGVAMHDDGQDAIAAGVADAGLLGARAAEGDRVDGLQMAGVRDEMQVDGAAVRSVVLAGGAKVILHVAAAQHAARVDIFELCEELGGRAADGVDHDVEASAMAHGEHGRLDAEGRARCQQLVEERDEDGEAFEREALGAEVARLDDLLEDVGADEVGEDAPLGGRRGGLLDLVLEPLALLVVRDVHELGGDGAAVVGAGLVGQLALGHGLGERLRRQVLAERIERGLQVSPAAEDVEDGVALGGVCRGRGWGQLCAGGHWGPSIAGGYRVRAAVSGLRGGAYAARTSLPDSRMNHARPFDAPLREAADYRTRVRLANTRRP